MQRCNFRSLVVRPKDLQYKLATYSDRDADLTTHMVSLGSPENVSVCNGEGGREGGEAILGAGGDRGAGAEEEGSRRVNVSAGSWRALVLSFTLPPSCYATMMVSRG